MELVETLNELNVVTPNRDTIVSFEKMVSAMPNAQFGDMPECPLKHSFADGIYVREIFIPAGTLLVGKIHKHEHPNMFVSGDVSVYTEYDGVQRLNKPTSMISKSGTKRVVYAHQDTIWITYHRTDKTGLKEIEAEIIVPSYDDLELSVDTIKQIKGE